MDMFRLTKKITASIFAFLFIGIIAGCQNNEPEVSKTEQLMAFNISAPEKSAVSFGEFYLKSRWWTPDGKPMYLYNKKVYGSADCLTWGSKATDSYNQDTHIFDWPWELIRFNGGYAIKCRYPYFADGNTYSYYLTIDASWNRAAIAKIAKSKEAEYLALGGFPTALTWTIEWMNDGTSFFRLRNGFGPYLHVENRYTSPMSVGGIADADPDGYNEGYLLSDYSTVQASQYAPKGWWSSQWEIHWYSDDE
jgi:hypothetical protein